MGNIEWERKMKSLSENVAAAILAASEGGILPPVDGQIRGWKPLSLAGWEVCLHILRQARRREHDLGEVRRHRQAGNFDAPAYLQQQAGLDSLIAFSTTSRVSPVSF